MPTVQIHSFQNQTEQSSSSSWILNQQDNQSRRNQTVLLNKSIYQNLISQVLNFFFKTLNNHFINRQAKSSIEHP